MITATPARRAIIAREWVSHGTHINAIGADTKGKQELDPALLQVSRVVVDNFDPSRALGELQELPAHWLDVSPPFALGRS